MRELDKKEHFKKNRFSISPSRQYLVNRVASELEPIKPKGLQLVSPLRAMQQTTLPPITEEFGKKRNSFVHFQDQKRNKQPSPIIPPYDKKKRRDEIRKDRSFIEYKEKFKEQLAKNWEETI